jgi:hypothetical protein
LVLPPGASNDCIDLITDRTVKVKRSWSCYRILPPSPDHLLHSHHLLNRQRLIFNLINSDLIAITTTRVILSPSPKHRLGKEKSILQFF